ncbi:MAG: aminopeptidase P family N-terminal domain-containing protein, partial [Hungatella sp.]
MIQERIVNLRKLMQERHIDVYMVPTSDFHESEYVGDYFKCRRFITGFTGSAGTALITQTEAGLWTDGRYFVQAAKELEGTGVTLRKMGQEGVPTIEEYLQEALPEGGCLGFDGRVVNSELGEALKELLASKSVIFHDEEDLVGQIWSDRPAISAEPVWILEECYAGKSASQKIEDLRSQMKKDSATIHILTTIDDIAWLLNIRGNDVECNPVVLSYVMISEKDFFLFINETVLDEKVKAYLQE